MNIAVIFTGGTIGSTIQDQYVSTDAQAPYRLLSMYKQSLNTGQSKEAVDFTTYAPYTTLSEYLDGSHLNKLITCIKAVLETDTDGIIVTHGTDTLPFTAAALGMIFAYAKIPIILVSSNYILDDPRANGLVNFATAVDYICNRQVCRLPDTGYPTPADHKTVSISAPKFQPLPTAVGIAYRNMGSTPKIYNALGIYNHYPFDDSLYERPYEEYADAVAPVLEEFSGQCQTASANQSTDSTATDSRNTVAATNSYAYFDTACPVCYFRSTPGQQYYLPEDARAILIHAYHSGTINTKNPSLLALTEQAAQKKIPIYLTGISAYSTDYDSKAAYAALGIIPLPEYSPIVAYMYLWYKYSHHKHPNA